MQFLISYYEQVAKFLDRGGPVMMAIIAASIVMWTLIVERYWYLYFGYPKRLRRVVSLWESRGDRSSWYAHRVREKLIAELSIPLQRHLVLIRNLTAVLPLLGLLGTVSGMITTFEVLSVFGTDNARGLTAGISEALLTTLAGLVTAVSGLYFSVHLRQRARIEKDRAADRLKPQAAAALN